MRILLAAVITISSALPAFAQPVPAAGVSVVAACHRAAGLDRLIAAQADARSPLYHRYLSPGQFESSFAPTPAEYARIVTGLRAGGSNVNPVRSIANIGGCDVAIVRGLAAGIVNAYERALAGDTRPPPIDGMFPADAGFQAASAMLRREAAAEGLGDSRDASFLGVLMWHNDLARTGQNNHEVVLTPSNVNVAHFGKRYARHVDGQVYAQPLYVKNVSMQGAGMFDVVYVATEHDGVYAFDATGARSMPLWRDSFIDPSQGITTMPCTSQSQPECDPTILVPEHGITATPVIDPLTNTMYVVAKTVEHGNYRERLHALDITTGAERPGSPIIVSATAPGHPNVHFSGLRGLSRAGLVLLNGNVHVSYASNDDDRGWMLAFNAVTLALESTFCVAPDGQLGAIWGSGAAPAVDANGFLYFMTGNGSFDAYMGGADFGMSMLKLQTIGGPLHVRDYFTPHNAQALSSRDLDLGSGGVMVLPDQPGAHPHEVVGAFKTGRVFLVDRDSMGGFNPANDRVIETFIANPVNGYWSSPAFFNNTVYFAGVGAPLDSYAMRNGLLSTSPATASHNMFNYPGATPSISSNGSADGIVWAVSVSGQPSGGAPAVLHAYRADDVSVELYDSAKAGSRDRAGPGVKMTPPTIADGKVFVATQTELDVYGPLP